MTEPTEQAGDDMEEAAEVATEQTAPPADPPSGETRTEVESVNSADGLFPDLADTGVADGSNRDMSLLMDIPVQLTVELGRKRVPIKHVLQLAQGSVIELDAMAGEPMDVLVNGCLIAQGEVVVVNDRFGVRLTEIVTPSERIKRLNRN